ncbi:MAG: FAD/NAD(P)-binding protein [Myxococcota bacterium]
MNAGPGPRLASSWHVREVSVLDASPSSSPPRSSGAARARRRVAILGGGFSGSALAIQLARAGGLDVTLVEPNAVGPGVAYATEPAHLLNVPAAKMSLFPDAPDDFLTWANAHGERATPTCFLPRAVYGAYVADTFARVAAPTIRVVHARVTSIEAVDGGARWTIRLDDGRALDADVVVLATGNPAPADPTGLAAIVASPRYVSDPWRRGALDAVAPEERILLVGTGLTALDVLVSLRERGHHGPIRALSRRGLLPQPHLVAGRLPAAAPVTIPLGASLEEMVRIVHIAARGASARGQAWQGVIDGLRGSTSMLWASLSPVERRRFLRHLRPYWEVHRHRAPESVLRHVGLLRASGALEVVAGRIVGASPSPAGVEVSVRRRHAADVEIARYDRVVNTTGPDTDLARSGGPLIRGLLQRGLLLQDPDRLGLRTDATGAAIGADGAAHASLYVLGQARRADLWEHTAVPDLSKGAAALATHLVATVAASATVG